MPPIKVVILLESLMHGGVQQGALLLAPRLDKSKYAVEVWALRNKKRYWRMAPEFEKAGVPIRAFPIKGFHDNAGIMRLAHALASEKIALLNTRSFYPNILGRIAARLARTPVVVAGYHHTYDHRWTKDRVAEEKLLRADTQRFVCVSRAVEDYLATKLDLPRERALTLYNGLDIAAHKIGESKLETRKRLGFPVDAPLVANVGRLTGVKDLPTFLKAARIVANQNPAVRFLVVGDGDESKKIRRESRELGLDGVVSFLGSRDDVPYILHASDMVVSTSLLEGFPRIVLEAFSAQRPMISTPAGGVPEIIEHGRNGLIITFKDAELAARAILELVADPDLAHRLGEAAHHDVQKFTLENWIGKTEEIFDAAIATRADAITDMHSRTFGQFGLLMRLRLMMFRLRTLPLM